MPPIPPPPPPDPPPPPIWEKSRRGSGWIAVVASALGVCLGVALLLGNYAIYRDVGGLRRSTAAVTKTLGDRMDRLEEQQEAWEHRIDAVLGAYSETMAGQRRLQEEYLRVLRAYNNGGGE